MLLLISCGGSQEQGAGRLASSESPYLREHADNPVNWYPWGDEAFERARKENKPVIVSIGYAACHWCHVMERESFMDPEVARIMNDNFISIKVDREERPDVDQQFVYASTALTGTAGWPLNAFALPDGKPFHTITYYAKTEWMDLLNRVSEAWRDDSNKLKKQAESLTQGIKPLFEYKADTVLQLDLGAFVNHIPSWYTSLDFDNGGVTGSPKFPMPSLIEFMLQRHRITGDKRAGQWTTTTLDAIANGGLYDHVGGGFSRYSTDALWQVPHFEKMLYDNGLLASVYAKAFKATKNARYEQVVRETLEFVEREMMSGQFLCYSSINADSEDEEGKFYKWTTDELRSILGDNDVNYLDINDGVLTIKSGADIDSLKQRLYTARARRVPPSIDKKIITSWNAMIMIAYIDAFTAFGDQKYIDKALKIYDALNTKMKKGDRLFHSTLDAAPVTEGFLDDYAWFAKASIHLYEATLDITFLNQAKALADIAIERFKNQQSPLFYYSTSGDSRLIRNVEVFDLATPSSNSVLAEVLQRLGEYYQNENYTTICNKAISEAISSPDLDATSISNWARIADIVYSSPYEVAVVGENAALHALELQKNYLPTALFMGGSQENLPLLENKLVEGSTIIYVCRNRTCKQPVKDPNAAILQIVYK
ncbi:MAG TPA: thioredoxin domain-containing protein [Cyclobacteriaceae bacterium]|nr:thioredoxin domain-containing protein [Cyclobacteriaceae bacterium]